MLSKIMALLECYFYIFQGHYQYNCYCWAFQTFSMMQGKECRLKHYLSK